MKKIKMFVVLVGVLLLSACGNVNPLHPAAKKCKDVSTGQRPSCFTQVALEKKNANICDYIGPIGFRVTCKKQLAVQECDKKLCEKIDGEWKHESCFEAVDSHYDCKNK